MKPIQQSSQRRQNGLAMFLLLAWPIAGFGQTSLVDGSFLVGAGATGLHEYGAVHSIIVQSNGTIFVGGRFDTISDTSHSNLARLNSEGSYDGSFDGGTDGLVNRLLEQRDGKILVAGGFTNLQGVVRQRIGRLLADGQVDLKFDAGSLLETERSAMTIAVQPDGKVLLATEAGPAPVARLFRLHANGALDESFVQTNLFRDWEVYAIHVRTNGTILVGGGFSSAGGHSSPALVRLHSDGRLDTNFNAQLENHSLIFAIHQQTNGNLLIGGLFKRLGTTNDILLARLTANLEWDDSFSTDEFLTYPEGFPAVRAIVEQPDGKLVVTGDFRTVGGYWRRNIARLDAQGRVDGCFDPGLGLNEHYLGGITLARQNDGRILVGGYFDSVDGRPLANVARLLQSSDCDAVRVHFGQISGGEYHYVAATSPPVGELYVQTSTNLVHWEDLAGPGTTYLIRYLFPPLKPQLFFRARKVD